MEQSACRNILYWHAKEGSKKKRLCNMEFQGNQKSQANCLDNMNEWQELPRKTGRKWKRKPKHANSAWKFQIEGMH
jgi:hypothetical protein